MVRSPQIIKKLRSVPLVNHLVRRAIVQAAAGSAQAVDWLTSRWRVAGEVEVNVAGHRLRMVAEADDAILNRLFYEQEWESGELQAWSMLVRGAGTVFDVGANTGVYSLLSAVAEPGARIFAFEPHPTNYARLAANVALGDMRAITAIERAVGDRAATIELTIPENGEISLVSSAVRQFSESHSGGPYKQHPVVQTTLDAFVHEQGLRNVDLIKIDVEYYELAVLLGAERTLAEHGPVVMCEVFDYEVFTSRFPRHAGRISPTQHLETEELFRRHGYHAYYVGKEGLLRVSDLQSNPDGGSNFVFSRVKTPERFLPWSAPERVRLLTANA